LLLHFCYTSKAYQQTGNKTAADNVISDLKKHLPSYEKSRINWFDELISKIDAALKHANQLQTHNIKTNSQNPATNVHELIEHLKNLKNYDIKS